MFYELLAGVRQCLFRRAFQPPHDIVPLGDLEALARSGPAAWLLAQEKARLDYVAARETYTRTACSDALQLMGERLLQLQSTNALVQALLNEHYLERLLTEVSSAPSDEFSIGKSR